MQADISNAREIGALIRRRRKELGLDQATLARKAGVSRLWISEIERGKDTASIGLVFKTLEAISLTLTTRLTIAAEPDRTRRQNIRNDAGEIDLGALLDRARRIDVSDG